MENVQHIKFFHNQKKNPTVTIRPILSDSVLEILMLNVLVSFFATIKLPYNIFN